MISLGHADCWAHRHHAEQPGWSKKSTRRSPFQPDLWKSYTIGDPLALQVSVAAGRRAGDVSVLREGGEVRLTTLCIHKGLLRPTMNALCRVWEYASPGTSARRPRIGRR